MVGFYSGKFSDSKEDGLLRQGKNWNKKIFMCTFDYEFKNASNFFSKRCKSLIARNGKFFKWIMVKVWSVIRGKYSICLDHLFTGTMVIVLSEKTIKRELVKITRRTVYIWSKSSWKWTDNDSGPENGDTWLVIGKLAIVSE